MTPLHIRRPSGRRRKVARIPLGRSSEQMGIGVSLAFIALGAILAFALRVDLSGIDIQLVG